MALSAPVLSAVGSAEELQLLNAIILTLSIFSALGSAWMILSFVVSKQLHGFVVCSLLKFFSCSNQPDRFVISLFCKLTCPLHVMDTD